MRVAALLRRTSMDDCDRFYAAAGAGAARRGPQAAPAGGGGRASCDRSVSTLAWSTQAIDDPTTHDDVRRTTTTVVGQGGFGVPTLVFDDGSHLYGPVITPAALGDDALALWDLVPAHAPLPAPLRDEATEDRRRHAPHRSSSSRPYLTGRDWETRERPAR